MFDGAFTAAGGLRGPIGPIDGDQPFAWTRVAPNGEAALRKLREGSRHAAIVAVTLGGKPGLCPVNAGWFSEPFGPPVLQISSEHLGAIEAASASHAEVRVVAHATRKTAQAFNVVADVPGTDPALPPVCVMTPRSGWHANASERGGGIVCWLETMRAVVARPVRLTAGPKRSGRNAADRNSSVVSGLAGPRCSALSGSWRRADTSSDISAFTIISTAIRASRTTRSRGSISARTSARRPATSA